MAVDRRPRPRPFQFHPTLATHMLPTRPPPLGTCQSAANARNGADIIHAETTAMEMGEKNRQQSAEVWVQVPSYGHVSTYCVVLTKYFILFETHSYSHSILLVASSNIFLSHQINTNHQPTEQSAVHSPIQVYTCYP